MSTANGGTVATTSGGMKPVQIAQVKGNTRENRTAAHSHIKGLGLRSDGRADTNAQGFVGQVSAREVGLATKCAVVAMDTDDTYRQQALLSI